VADGTSTLREGWNYAISFASIAEELGHQYTIGYRPTNHAHDGKWRTVQIKLSKPDVTVRTRKGYRAPKG
jgi:Ca-activated chloride channel family protein